MIMRTLHELRLLCDKQQLLDALFKFSLEHSTPISYKDYSPMLQTKKGYIELWNIRCKKLFNAIKNNTPFNYIDCRDILHMTGYRIPLYSHTSYKHLRDNRSIIEIEKIQ